MSEFAMEDWDLQAVVRGFSSGSTSIESPSKWFGPLSTQHEEDDDLFLSTSIPEFYDTATVLDELEQLYKPFYPMFNPISPQTIFGTSSILSVHKQEKEREREREKEREQEEVQDKQSIASPENIVASDTSISSHEAKHRKRKNQQKKVVLQVTADGLSSDMWAWRKYGQKPIKGSPYPRSYYRCSSLKGCLARKQVERSHLDPTMFIVTYTAEHSHAKPTRRSSLAGTTRQRSPTSTGNDQLVVTPTASPISAGSTLSPTTIEDDQYFLQAETIKNECKVDDEQVVQDMILSDDFFSGLDFGLDGLAPDVAFDYAIPDQFNFQMSFPC
ncbi:WRKY transcription factor 22-like [Cornus florida]|uniref:WRKY transcription factor 22-like n=1 Tax=Cornus florida TaxID=4283 RepID=UPI0028989638|nr:WRKY transcription factor 22-like [Cornus florida]